MIRTYDPTTVHVLVAGFPIGGFADGQAIKAMRSMDTFEKIEGINGIISRSKNLNKSGEITLTLSQTSRSNDVLSVLALTDELSSNGIVPIAILDSRSATVLVSAFAWIKKPAEVINGKELENREWIFETADIDVFVGGNTES
jgi:hypothetical protein